jgi:hypothetical protein
VARHGAVSRPEGSYAARHGAKNSKSHPDRRGQKSEAAVADFRPLTSDL